MKEYDNQPPHLTKEKIEDTTSYKALHEFKNPLGENLDDYYDKIMKKYDLKKSNNDNEAQIIAGPNDGDKDKEAKPEEIKETNETKETSENKEAKETNENKEAKEEEKQSQPPPDPVIKEVSGEKQNTADPVANN